MTTEGFSLKEMVTKVLEQNEQALITQTKILQHSEKVDEHLRLLNSKVATHELVIGELKTEHTKFKAITATAWTMAGMIWATFTFFWKN